MKPFDGRPAVCAASYGESEYPPEEIDRAGANIGSIHCTERFLACVHQTLSCRMHADKHTKIHDVCDLLVDVYEY